MIRRATALFLAVLVTFAGTPANAESPDTANVTSTARPRLALIIDDLGQHPSRDRQVLALPGPVALSILPDTPHATSLAHEANAHGKTVMLHLPMDPATGPFAWHPGMTEEELAKRLEAALAVVPNAEGLNNHMGSRMTEQRTAMAWLMKTLQARHLYFVDSRTSASTVAAAEAQRIGLASLSRDVFLDDDQSATAVARQYQTALATARKYGSVVMIGHPHPTTLALLQRELPRLAGQGIDWISVDMMIAVRANRAMPAHGRNGVYR